MDYDVLYYDDTINSTIAKGLKWKLNLLFERTTSNNTIVIFYDDGNGLKKSIRLHTKFHIIALERRSHRLKKQNILDDKLAIYFPENVPGPGVKLLSINELITATGLSFEESVAPDPDMNSVCDLLRILRDVDTNLKGEEDESSEIS